MPRKIPASLTRRYNSAIKRQGDAAERSVRAALNEYLRQNPDATIEEIRNFAIDLMTAAGDLYGNACSQAAFELQDEIAREFSTKPPDVGGWYYEPDAESISRTAHYHAGKLKDGDRKGFVDQIADAARYYSERGANTTMAQTARRQASSKGGKSKRKGSRTHGVLFARVPTGATTCPFCLMLASRGFVYLSKESAGEFDRFHRHCDCRIVPGYPGMELEGYDPNLYYDMWKNPEKYAEQNVQVNEFMKLRRGQHPVTQEKIDEMVDGPLAGMRFPVRPVYNPKIGVPGKTTIKIDSDGNISVSIEIGKQYKPGDEELLDTLIHENLEARIGVNSHSSEKYYELNDMTDDERHEYIQRIIDRYVKMRKR